MTVSFGVLVILGFVISIHGQGEGDNPQVFYDANDGDLQGVLSRGIKEGTPVGTVIGKLKAYVQGRPDIVVTFKSVSSTLTATSDGTVTLKRELDRDNAQENNDLQATWTAFYLSNNGDIISVVASVTVTVNDVNDNPPRFLNIPYSAQIPEDTAIGTTVFNGIVVKDIDLGFNAEVELKCYIAAGDTQTIEACDYFNLTTRQLAQGDYRGAIVLKKNLDYEIRKGFTMTIQARDNFLHQGNEPSLNTSVNVLLEVEDRQDTPPLFTDVPITIFVVENLTPGRDVYNVTAKDGDEGAPRPIKIVNKDPQQLFKVGNTTKVRENTWVAPVLVNKDIDREVLQARYTFDIEAIELDNGIETNQTRRTTVTVNIQDLDDNQPMFEFSEYSVNVTEMDSQTTGVLTPLPGFTMRVTDPDDASFAKFNLSIKSAVPHDNFLISPTTGVGSAVLSLTIKNPSLLDYEVVSDRVQTVIVEVMDARNKNKVDVATVTINLLDANDNYPEFQQTSYFLTAREDLAVGQPLGTITGIDKDSGMNGELRYSLTGTGADVFNVDPVTGIISLAKPLDFEGTQSYSLLFEATDQGPSPRQTRVPLSINVLNFNDFGPVFNPATYTTSVRETETTLLIPVTVQATDRESGNNITYRIVAGNTAVNPAFVIGLNSGILSVTREINYEETPNKRGFFVLTVEATDADQPPQKTNTTITVSIIDENNHNPIFAPSDYHANITEIADAGTYITTVTATDRDFGSNGEIKFYIWSGGQDNFDINPDTGKITVTDRKTLDFDNIQMYNVTIHARDQGGPPRTGTASVIVKITDANNKLPQFIPQTYDTKVQENVTIGTVVETVTATDPDSTSSIQYSIIRSSIVARDSNGARIQSVFPYDYRNVFTINETTGDIMTALMLSRDAAATIEFMIEARDVQAELPLIQTATAAVYVTILADANIVPEFAAPWTVNNPTYNFLISEEANITTMITTLIATDPAITANIQNFVEVPGSDVGDYFYVGQTTGQIRINKRLDFETLNKKYLSFSVIAIGSKAEATATVSIQVMDINDNAPQFLASSYSFSIDEDSVFPAQVGAVYASDLDSGSYSKLRYSLSGQGAEDFTMYTSYRQEGLIFLKNGTKLDHETTPVYNLQVVATDNVDADVSAEVQNTNSAALTITVNDINDNTPIFPRNYSFFTVESYEVGRVFGMVTATDGDRGLYGEILYILRALDDPDDMNRFSLHPDTGAFSSKASLEGLSRRSPIHFQVSAVDQGSPPRIGITYVEVNITSGQLDDGLPHWTRPAPDSILEIPEEQGNGTVIYTCKATAATPGASVVYSFVSSSDPTIEGLFKIDRTTCDISLKDNPDREFRETYDLIIVAQDTRNSTSRSSRKLTIRLTDVNDEKPSFRNCPDRQYAVVPPEPATVVEQSPPGTLVYTVKACDLDSNPAYNAVKYRFAGPDNFTHCYANPQYYFNLDSTTGKITTTSNVIDREGSWPNVLDQFILCVYAEQSYSGRRKRQLQNVNWTSVDTDQYLYLRVNVMDINDKTPYFTNVDEITTAVLKFPTSDDVVKLVAIDQDSELYNKVRFTITSIIFPSRGRNLPIDGAFTINPDTGQIRVGMPAYIAFTDGYFILDVRVEDKLDSTKSSTTTVRIYVSDEASQVRLVGQTNDLQDPSATADQIIAALKTKSGIQIQKTKIQYHKTLSGETVHAQTDFCFVFIYNNQVLDSQEGVAEITKSIYADVLQQFKVGDPGPCEPPTRKSTYDVYWWVLVAFAIFMFVTVAILVVVIWYFYNNYRQYMDTRKTYLQH